MSRAFISLILLLHCSQGTVGADDVLQEPKILWGQKKSSVHINCTHNKGSTYRLMYWYRQRQGQTMRLVAFTTSYTEPEYEESEQKKFMANKTVPESGSLTVQNLEPNDSAIYFCSVSESDSLQAYFGNGTKLTVLDPDIKVKTPEVKVLNETSCKDKVTLVCLAKKFYPDHVSIKWTLGTKEITEDVATDPNALQDDTKMFHISSRLKVPRKEFTTKHTYTCTVKFYNDTDKFEEFTATITGNSEGGFEPEVYLKSSKTISLGYGVFIAKSALYGIIILVFVCRKGSRGKRIN